jgi:hypothetical protein
MPKSRPKTKKRIRITSAPNYGPHLKTDLFVKIHDLQGIDTQLEKIMLMPRHQRLQWAEENEMMLTSLLDTFVEDSTIVVDGIDQDSQTLNLSMEYIGSLKDVMYKVRSILYEQDQLES